MSSLALFISLWGAASVLMALLWASRFAKRNAGVVDLAWSLGTGAAAGVLALTPQSGDSARALLVTLLAAIWALRLASHLGARMRRETEDGRYTYLRSMLGANEKIGLFVFFQVQAAWVVLFAAPMWAAARAERPLDWLDALGVVLWLVGLGGESIADRQLARCKRADPEQVCDSGLWGRSRHPNYFFEWLHWFGYVCIGWGSPWWWVTALAVVVMYVFLTRVTGIPFTEAQSIRRRGERYRRYQTRTPAFFPRISKPS